MEPFTGNGNDEVKMMMMSGLMTIIMMAIMRIFLVIMTKMLIVLIIG